MASHRAVSLGSELLPPLCFLLAESGVAVQTLDSSLARVLRMVRISCVGIVSVCEGRSGGGKRREERYKACEAMRLIGWFSKKKSRLPLEGPW